MSVRVLLSATLVSAALISSAHAGIDPLKGSGSIQIVSASFGSPDAARQINFAEDLQNTCGPDASSCQVFCSRSFVRDRTTRFLFAAAPICRVVYRCGETRTKAVDAELNDRLTLSCSLPNGPQ